MLGFGASCSVEADPVQAAARGFASAVQQRGVSWTVRGVAIDLSNETSDPDAREFESLYRAHFGDLVRVAFLMTGSAAAAEDAVQDVFMRCAHRLSSLDDPRSYLRVCVVNECRTRHRRGQRLQEDGEVVGEMELSTQPLETREALAKLTPRRRAAVVMRYFLDLDDAEIAAALGCRPATVRSLVHRGLDTLRKELT